MWKLEDGQDKGALIDADSPYKTFVLDLKDSNEKHAKDLGTKRNKALNEYVSKFYVKLCEQQTAGNENGMNSSSMGCTDTSLSLSSVQTTTTPLAMKGLNVGDSTEISRAMVNATAQQLSPISTSSNHHLDVSDMTTHTQDMFSNSQLQQDLVPITNQNPSQEKQKYSFRLFLDQQDHYTFSEESINAPVPKAKPFHMYTDQDLKFVQCTASFLYLVFRNPVKYEVTFFKVSCHACKQCVA
jgi:hypothetical protein